MKKTLISSVVALAVIAIAFVAIPEQASAQQFNNYSGCPSAQVYYTNGYSNTHCVASYYPGYPTYPTASIFSTANDPYPYGGGGSTYGGGSSPYNLYHSPHPFGPWQYNQPFYPYNPTPTYYYPPAQTYNHGAYYNTGYNSSNVFWRSY